MHVDARTLTTKDYAMSNILLPPVGTIIPPNPGLTEIPCHGNGSTIFVIPLLATNGAGWKHSYTGDYQPAGFCFVDRKTKPGESVRVTKHLPDYVKGELFTH